MIVLVKSEFYRLTPSHVEREAMAREVYEEVGHSREYVHWTGRGNPDKDLAAPSQHFSFAH